MTVPERALQRRREEPDAVHLTAARGRDYGRPETEDSQDHQLDQTGTVTADQLVYRIIRWIKQVQ